ncbi:MAG: 6-carboxytetrahydropterin synthase [Deltaproteobacteria bacterium]|nr:6-carboxytetrahydropterin synthase [Deltaproteobacteria bacterium]MBW2673450.1 6-carboxytetrahydropterin synthase [Deltaproteobacteria bacterium]
MYEITVHKTFSAAHTLDIGGKREDLHGHNFKVEATIASEGLNEDGLVLDFRVLKQWVNTILEELDHTYLNDRAPFRDIGPTAEHIARFIYDRLEKNAAPLGLAVSSVAVWESEGSKATYTTNRPGS